jgi:ribonuclease P protein component
VYKNGKVIISTDKKLKANYLSYKGETNQVKIATSVSSKAGNSVWRNRLRRIIRESLRQEEDILKKCVLNNNLNLSIIVSPYRINLGNLKHPCLKDIQLAVVDIIYRINKSTNKN